MSKQVDERIVSMQFDNKHFESNVKTSMSTIDKLKEKLNFKDADKSLDGLSKSAKNVDMNTLANSVETVRSKFSALEVMGVTALANITNSAVNAGKQIAKSLTIEPITTGFNEYELKMDSIKTIMASTGKSVETVNKYLEELNEYSDQTIYSFSDMTQNIGKFTNAGVALEDAVMAIKGISNEAAVSGANANEASRAMYNFAQALSAGYVKLIDWKSIENANMATKEFKEQLIQSAVAAGTLTESSDGMYQTLKGNALTATKNFNETLQDQWMTTEVLVNTLKDYADNTTEIGKKAFAAAQDVTKFTQMMDVLKETAQSGWAKTWELIFGDIEQAKAIFTPLTNFFSGIIDGISDFRNNLIEGALSSPLGQFAQKVANVTSATTEAVNKVQDFGEIVNKVINGELGNGQSRFDKLAEAGYDWAHVQNLVNEKLGDSTRHATDYKEAQGELTEQIVGLTDAELKNLNFTEEEIKLFRELEQQSKATGVPISELAAKMEQLDGRTMIIESFKNVGSSLVKIIKAIKDAWVEVFPPMTSQQLYNIIEGLYKLSQHLSMSDASADNLKRTLKGLFAALDIVLTIIGGPIKIAWEIFTKILEAADLSVLEFTAGIGDAIVGFRDFIDSAIDFSGIFETIAPYIIAAINAIKEWVSALQISENATAFFRNSIDAIKEWFSELKNSDNIPRDIILGLVNGLKSGVSTVISAVISLGKAILDGIKGVLGIHSPSTEFFEIGKNVIEGFLLGLQNGASTIWEFIKGIGQKCIDVIKGIDFGKVFALAVSIGILATLHKLTDIIASFAAPFEGLGQMLEGLGDMFEDVGKGIKNIGKGVKNYLNSKAVLNMALAIGILAASVVALTMVDTNKLWGAVGALAALSGIIIALSVTAKLVGGAKGEFGKLSAALVGISASMLIMAIAIKKLEFLNEDNIGPILAGLSAMVIGMAAVLAAFGIFVKGKGAQNIAKAGVMLLAVSIVMLQMVKVIKQVSELDAGALIKGGACIVAFGGIITGLMAATNLAGKHIGKAGAALLQVSAAILLLVMVAKICANMSVDDMVKGALCIAAFGGIITGLIAATKLAGNVKGVGSALLGMSASILILVGVAKLCASMSVADMVKGALCIAAFGGIIAGLIAVTKLAGETKGLTLTLLAMSVSIGILAAIAVVLSLVDTAGLAKGIIAVGLLSGLMSLMIIATKNAQDCKGNLIAITVAIGVMAAAVAALSLIDPTRLAGATIAMGLLMGVFALIVKMAGQAQSAMGTLIVITAAIGVLGGVLYLLSGLPVESVLGSSAALSVLLLSMAASLAIISGIGPVSIAAIASLAAMTLVVVALAGVLHLLAGLPVESVMGATIALSALLLSMSAALLLVGSIGPLALVGVASLALMTLVVTALTGVLYLLSGLPVEETMGAVTALIALMASLVIFTVAAGAISGLIGPAMVAVLGLGVIAAELALVIAALGALAQIPGLEWLIGEGGDLLQKIGTAIGQFIGGIIGGVAQGMTSVLPQMGADLSAFMTSVMPFIAGAQMIDPSSLEGVKALVEAILLLTAANLIESLTSWLTGGTDFVEFGRQIAEFGPYIKQYADSVNGINCEAIKASAEAAKALVEVAKAVPNEGGWAAAIMGDNSLVSFAESLIPLGPAMKQYADNVNGVNCEAIKASAEAAKALVEVAEAVPNEGGWAAAIMGDNSLADFAVSLLPFGPAIKNYSDSVNGINCDAIKASAKAAKALVEVAEAVPNEGGWAAAIMGDNTLADFAESLIPFGKNMKLYADSVKDIQAGSMSSINSEIKSMVSIASSVENLNAKSFESNASSLVDGLEKIKDFMSEASGMDASGISAFTQNLKTLANAGISTLAETFKGGGPIVSSSISGMLKTAANTDVSSMFTGLGNKIVSNIVKGIKSQNGTVTEASKAVITGAKKAMDGKYADFNDIGKKIVESFVKGIKSQDQSVTETSTAVVTSSKDAMDGLYTDFYDIGADLVRGFANGISANTYLAVAKAKAMAEAAELAAKNALGINSPSKKFMAIGSGVVEGFSKGVTDNAGDLNNSAKIMSDTIVGATKKELQINSPSLIFDKEVGRYIVQGVAEGIKKDTSAEEAAEKKAQNITTAFKNAIDREDMYRSITKQELENWQLGEGLGASDAVKDAKELEYLNKDLLYVKSQLQFQHDQYTTMVNTYGKNSDKAKQAWKEYLQGQGEVLTIQNNINTVTDRIIKRTEAQTKGLNTTSPCVTFSKDLGRYVVQNVADGITKDMSAEEAAKKKAENISSAFKGAIDREDLYRDITNQELENWLVGEGAGASDAEKEAKQLEYLNKDFSYLKTQLGLKYDQYITLAEEYGKNSDKAKEAWLEYLQGQNEVLTAQKSINEVTDQIARRTQSQADGLNKTSPYVTFSKDLGRYVVQNIADGIDSDTSAEDAAARKAQNISNAFKDVIDRENLESSILDTEFEIWKNTDGAKANEDAIDKKEIEYNNKRLPYKQEVSKLKYDEYLAFVEEFGESSYEARQAWSEYRSAVEEETSITAATIKANERIANRSKEAAAKQKSTLKYNKDIGKFLVQNIAAGITEDMTAEEAAEKKAQNIAEAFREEIEKHDLFADIIRNEFEIWKRGEGKDADEKVVDAKELEYLSKELAYIENKEALAYNEYLATVDAFGKNAKESKEAWNKYYEARLETLDVEEKISEVNERIANRAVEEAEDNISRYERSIETRDKLREEWLRTDGKKASDADIDARLIKDLKKDISDYQKMAEESKRKVELLKANNATEEEIHEEWLKTQEYEQKIFATQEAIIGMEDDQLERDIAEYSKAVEINNKLHENWLKTRGKNASDAEKDAHAIETIDQEIAYYKIMLDKNNDRHEMLVKNNATDEEIYKAWQDSVDYENKIADLQDEKLAIKDNALQRAMDGYDYNVSSRDRYRELWDETDGKDASDAEKDARAIEDLNADIADKSDKLLVASEAYTKAVEDHGMQSEEARKAWDNIVDIQLDIAKDKNEISQIQEDALTREREALEEQHDLASDNADLEYQIWEKTLGRKATSAEKDVAKLTSLSNQLLEQSSLVLMAREDWEKACNEYGKSSNEAQKAYGEYLQKQLNLANIQNEITDINEAAAERQKLAKSEYEDYIEKYKDFYTKNGMSMAELEKDAKLVSGYDPNSTVNTIVDKTNTALKNVQESEGYNELLSNFNAMGVSYVDAVNNGVVTETASIVNCIIGMIDKCTATINTKQEEWKAAGKYLVDGFALGITNNIQTAVNKVVDLSAAVTTAMQKELGINSPSRAFAIIGMYAVQGLAKGLYENSDLSDIAATDIGKSAIANLQNSIKRISEVVESDIDTQPTIRPVLDLSNVESGANRLNAMFSRTQAMSISNSMNKTRDDKEIQNGTNNTPAGNNYSFVQNNYSPKALSRSEIYRQTKNQFAAMKGAMT